MPGQHRKEFALAVEAAALGQQITGDQNEAGPLPHDYARRLLPLGDMLM
jgi:hypothetical protein